MSASRGAALQRYVAFLRAINVGGHVVKMADLRAIFEALRFANVETFIASGNVLFGSAERDVAALELKIERRLARALGYDVATFLRTPSELSRLVDELPFTDDVAAGCSLSVAFLKAPPEPAAVERLDQLRSSVDELLVRGRELYWLCRGRTSESKVWRTPLEKVIGMPATLRNATTVRKLAIRTSGVA
ncbi:MAG TPA: DUF1697 domain-containing protein [Gemmatimonadaceae bacterium]|nr:DUF1697 domain-containing protein [Gemmatimonadaceae bacterium]